MEAYDAILLTLHANDELLGNARVGERPIGRTAMQKLVYFEAQKIPNEIGFKAHHYGPFSPQVAEGLARLGAFGYLREDVPGVYELSYEYHLTRDGQAFATDLSRDNEHYGKIRDVVETAAKHCELRQLVLAHAAKTHFLRKKSSKENPSSGEIVACGKDLGWDMEREDVEGGLKLLHALKLD